MVTAVLVYINEESGKLIGTKQLMTNKNRKEVQTAACSSCQLLPGLCVKQRCVSWPQWCVAGARGHEAVTSQGPLQCQSGLLLAGFGLQSRRKTRRVPQAMSISIEATTSFVVRSLKCKPIISLLAVTYSDSIMVQYFLRYVVWSFTFKLGSW